MAETVLVAFLVFMLVVAGMAVGVMVQGKRITGSCGGLSNIKGIDNCTVCGRDLRDVDVENCEGVPNLSASRGS